MCDNAYMYMYNTKIAVVNIYVHNMYKFMII